MSAAVDPLYSVSARRSLAAAQAALLHYLKAVPQLYTQAVHDAAVQQAMRLYRSAAAGPALPDLQQQLLDRCLSVWKSGRQQCGAVSLTGRSGLGARV
eukprot:gene9973-10127_t